MSFFKNIFSLNHYGETHWLLYIFGVKIKFPKSEFARKKKESLYYYYKNNNIDITTIPPATGQVRDIQLANLALLKEMDYVCKQAGLKYWLDSGTLLGAVRHKGFIPWDDDIDLGMLREDYDKIVEAFEKYSSNPDIYVDYKSVSRDRNCFLKVMHRKLDNIFVDIFPMDFYGKRLSVDEQLSKTEEILKIRHKYIDKLGRTNKAELLDQYNKIMQEFKAGNDENGDYVWGIDFKHWVRNWFASYDVLFPLKTITFEGLEFPCINDPESFLTKTYGDYMKYPSKISWGHAAYLVFTDDEKMIIDSLASQFKS